MTETPAPARYDSGFEQAAKKAGYDVEVPFAPGRTDASQAPSFAVL